MSSRATTVQSGLTATAPVRITVVVLTFFAVTLDGFDTASLGLAIPALSDEWGVKPAVFTAALMATNGGVVIGYIGCGHLSDKIGLRTVLMVGTAVFGVGSAATAISATPTTMAVARFVTGLGLGAVLPAAIALSTWRLVGRIRQRVAIMVTVGLSVGSLLAGLTGGHLIAGLGWESVFWLGAIAPVVLLPMMWLGIRVDETRTRDDGSRSGAGVARLFIDGLATRTIMLWMFAFLIFTAFYAFASWLPTLLTEYGFSPSMAPLGAASLGAGGIIGAMLLAAGSGYLDISKQLVIASVVAIGFLLVAVALSEPSKAMLLLMFTGVGAGLASSMVGQAAAAVATYPEASRADGVGWAAAMGRAGSLVGPAIGGALLAAGASARSVMLVLCIPVVLAAVTMFVMSRLLRRTGQV